MKTDTPIHSTPAESDQPALGYLRIPRTHHAFPVPPDTSGRHYGWTISIPFRKSLLSFHLQKQFDLNYLTRQYEYHKKENDCYKNYYKTLTHDLHNVYIPWLDINIHSAGVSNYRVKGCNEISDNIINRLYYLNYTDEIQRLICLSRRAQRHLHLIWVYADCLQFYLDHCAYRLKDKAFIKTRTGYVSLHGFACTPHDVLFFNRNSFDELFVDATVTDSIVQGNHEFVPYKSPK